MMIRAMHEVNNGNADYYGADTTKTWLQAGLKHSQRIGRKAFSALLDHRNKEDVDHKNSFKRSTSSH